MRDGCFYYLTDQYFIDFNDDTLMRNKEVVNGRIHDRPCFYAFKDGKTEIYWMIPISSQVDKFKKLYDKKVKRFGRCDTLVFGKLLGQEKAFLIQNMCPTTEPYIKNQYMSSSAPVRVDYMLEKELRFKAMRVLSLQRKGVKLIFPDVFDIEQKLLAKNPDR